MTEHGESNVKICLTIAGTDSGGAAGIAADLKTFAAHGCYGTLAVTCVTAQSTLRVAAVHAVPPETVAAQVDAVLDDLGADAVKTGMLFSAGIIEAIADRLEAHGVTELVVDPVMVASTGAPLLEDEAVEVLRRRLLPRARVVTPNLPETEVLAGGPVATEAERLEAARRILELGPRVRGGQGRPREGPGGGPGRGPGRHRRAPRGPAPGHPGHPRHRVHLLGGPRRRPRPGRPGGRGGGGRPRPTSTGPWRPPSPSAAAPGP